MSWSDFYTANFSFDCLEFCHSEERGVWEAYKSLTLSFQALFKAEVLLAFSQVFVISLLFLSAAFWLNLLCFCWTSSPPGTKAGMKLSLQWCRVRAWFSSWNSLVLLWRIQYEYCDSHYREWHIKMRYLLQCCINTFWLCIALNKAN